MRETLMTITNKNYFSRYSIQNMNFFIETLNKKC